MDDADGRSALLQELARALDPVVGEAERSRLTSQVVNGLESLPPQGRSALLEQLARSDPGGSASLDPPAGAPDATGESSLAPDGRSALVGQLLTGIGTGKGDERSRLLQGALSSLLATPQGRSALVEQLARPPEDAADLSPGVRVGRFVLQRELGRGAFGVVFEARDTALGRQVAMKIVRPGGQLPSEARLRTALHEAEAIARLTHPNIVTVHDFGTSDAGPYIVMELLHGESLQSRLRREPFALREALRISIDVARALDHAHGAGILHRDLKPGNLFLTRDGTVKVLDFGFAEIFGDAHRLEGGTPAYMSPEQHVAGPVQDARTDVWSAAVVLFRMLTGELPFHPEWGWTRDAGAVPLPPPSVPGAPPSLGSLLQRALSVDPEARPRDGGAWLQALEAVAREFDAMERPGPSGTGVVVLPFADLGEPGGGGPLGGTIAEMLISELARVPALRVVPISTAIGYRGSGKSVTRVGAELGVGRAVEGSVTRSGDVLQIRVRLLDAATEQQLWTERYREPAGNVLDVLDGVVAEVARVLGGMLVPASPGGRPPRAVAGAAMDCYLRGRYHQEKRTPEGFAAALSEYRAASDADPLFVPPYVATAFIHVASAIYGQAPAREALTLARSFSERALTIDPENGSAMGSLALASLFLEHDFDGALRLGRRSGELHPREAMTRIMLGDVCWVHDLVDEAMTHILTARDVAPADLGVNMNVGDFLVFAGRHGEAVAAYRHTLRLKPHFVPGQVRLAKALAFAGDRAETEEALVAVASMAPEPIQLETSAICLGMIGERERALPLAREVERRAELGRMTAMAAANAWGALGEAEAAVRWIERAWELAEPHAVLILRYAPTARLADTPPLQELGRRLGLPRFRARA
jgi:TolB-like protein/tetratricopeptide (TPR) repeat protein